MARKKQTAFCLAILLTVFISYNQTAFAVGSTGIENASFSAESLSQADAVTAQANEPAAISYNPAGITQLPGLQVQGNMNFISTLTSFRSRTPDMVPGEKSSATIVPVPTGYFTLNPGELLGNKVAFGVGSDSPFGLSNKYDSDHPTVHYIGWRNWFKMYTIKPVVAVKPLDWLSIGAGPVWYRLYDWGGIEAYPNKLILAGVPDGQIRVNLAGQHWGWHAGILAKPHKQHQFGFYFRSPVVINTSGLIKVENGLSPGFTATSNFETGGHSEWALPLNFTWAYAYKPTDKATVEFDFGYTRWSILERLGINHDIFVSPTFNGFNDTILDALGTGAGSHKDFRDSYDYQLGGNYKFSPKLTGRLGVWYYTHAAPNSSFTPAVPDGDRIGIGTGVGYKITKYIIFDASYSPVWAIKRRINNDLVSDPPLNLSEDGSYASFTNEFSFALTYKWDNIFKDLGLSHSKQEEIANIQSQPTAVA